MTSEAAPVDAGESTDTTEVFSMRIGDFHVAFAADAVSSVLDYEAPTPVPGAPAYLLGVSPHGEGALGIVDLRRFVADDAAGSYPPRASDSSFVRVVVLRSGDLEGGFCCEQALGVSVQSLDALEASAEPDGRLRPLLRGQWQDGPRTLTLLDADALLEATRVRMQREEI